MSSKAFNNATKLNNLIDVTTLGLVADGTTDNTAALNVILELTSSTRNQNQGWANLYFPAGIYKIDGTVYVPGKAIFKLDGGCTIKLAGTSTSRFLNNTSAKPPQSAYTGYGDIWFLGGTFDCSGGSAAITFAHSHGLRFRDATFTNAKNTHFIEINSSKDVIFDSCVFKNMVSDAPGLYEMLQFDYSHEAGFPSFGGWDNTPCTDCVVQNCSFDTGQSGVGSHANPAGDLHTAITITNNTISNMAGDFSCGIRVQGWGYGCEVSNNYLKECGEKPLQVLGNTDGVEILYNTVYGGGKTDSSTGGYWFSLSDTVYPQKCTVTGNKAYNVFGKGFFFNGVNDSRITGNEVYKSNKEGYYFNESSRNTISTNIVNGCGGLAANTYDAFYFLANCSNNRIFSNTAKSDTGYSYRYALRIVNVNCSTNRVNSNYFDLGGTSPIVNDSGTLTELNGETFISAVMSNITTGTINLLDDITKYTGVKVATGSITPAPSQLYTDYARGWNISGFRVGTDSINVKTFAGTAALAVTSATLLTITGTASNEIRYIIGVEKL